MKEYIITIDGGTTNTRCILWGSGQRRIDEERRAVGVRNTSIDGNNHKLKQAVRNSTALKVDGDTLAVVGGKEPLRTAVADVLKYDGYFREVETFCPEGDIPLSARGAYIVARETGIL